MAIIMSPSAIIAADPPKVIHTIAAGFNSTKPAPAFAANAAPTAHMNAVNQ
ncbi:hypothetical protein EK0264_15865 [Epidermidibacterium keratini]|uniref:Uncharacterized protein n=1 Tax=Epidermidibacterium keratini TaxID=1891644 RepID=A0A7L4YR76_9ACTN|nr:hypothetical protein [Epidermidibacterium keratini]QHC01620.1 hypothetical protein EK0264_15865 [Epidermidibacterium keratini]